MLCKFSRGRVKLHHILYYQDGNFLFELFLISFCFQKAFPLADNYLFIGFAFSQEKMIESSAYFFKLHTQSLADWKYETPCSNLNDFK